MKAPLLVSAVSLAGLTVLACSKPDDRTPALARNLELLGAAAPDSAVLSPVEAGQGVRVPLLTRRLGGSAARRSAPVSTAAARADLEVAPQAQITAVESTSAPSLSEIPLPAGPLAVASSSGNENGHTDSGISGSGSGGEPTILIRGGIGSARDDCKIHGIGRAGAGGGILINRLAPPLRSGRAPASTFVGPVRIR